VQKLYKKGLAFRLKLYAECYVPKVGKKFVQKESTKGGVHPLLRNGDSLGAYVTLVRVL